jgi:hypothetical protein
VRKLPHIYCFRLSDEDNERYRNLLQRFHLDLRKENSLTFRLFIRALDADFRERRFEDLNQPCVQPVAQVERNIRNMDTDEDEELTRGMEEPWENERGDPDYSRFRDEAIERLIMRGEFASLENVLKEIEVFKRAQRQFQSKAINF